MKRVKGTDEVSTNLERCSWGVAKIESPPRANLDRRGLAINRAPKAMTADILTVQGYGGRKECRSQTLEEATC